jgi:hypothetical protein
MAQDQVFAITKKTLADLATVTLEERIGEVFTRRLRLMSAKDKDEMGAALKASPEASLVRSAFNLPDEQKAAIQNALNETFSAVIRVRYETDANAISGIELTAQGQKLSWSISSYLDSFDRSLAEAANAAEPKSDTRGQMSEPAGALLTALDSAFDGLRDACATYSPSLVPEEIGIITSLSTGIATISGLPNLGNEELVSFPGGRLGMAFNVDEDEVGLILLCDYQDLHVGDEVRRTGRVMDVGVGNALLGRVLDPLGRPIDGKPPVDRPSTACPWNGRHPRSWTAPRSAFLCKRD